MPFPIHHYLTMASFAVLLGCAASETDTPQAELKKSEPQTVSAGQKAYIDPATGKLTSTPPASVALQNRTSGSDTGPVVYNYTINEHGVGVLVPANPIRHGLNAKIDCDGNLTTGHDLDITKQLDCSQPDSITKEVK